MKICIKTLITFLLVGCLNSEEKYGPHTKLDVSLIENVFIKKVPDGVDSIELSKEQIQLFVRQWNDSKSRGLTKMIVEYWVTVHLKNDSTRNFRINGDCIKEYQDFGFSIKDSISSMTGIRASQEF